MNTQAGRPRSLRAEAARPRRPPPPSLRFAPRPPLGHTCAPAAAGPLLGQLFRQLFRKLSKDVQKYGQKCIDKGQDFSPVAAVQHKTISNGLKYALATGTHLASRRAGRAHGSALTLGSTTEIGNWGQQKSAPGSIRAGVSQAPRPRQRGERAREERARAQAPQRRRRGGEAYVQRARSRRVSDPLLCHHPLVCAAERRSSTGSPSPRPSRTSGGSTRRSGERASLPSRASCTTRTGAWFALRRRLKGRPSGWCEVAERGPRRA